MATVHLEDKMNKVWLSSEYEMHACLTCEITWAVPVDYLVSRRNDHKRFYCPNGHSHFYPQKSDKEKLREQVKHCKADAEFWKDGYDAQAERLRTVRRSRSAYMGQVTRMKNATPPKNGKSA